MSTVPESSPSPESDAMRILQHALAAAEHAVSGAEHITARASQLEGAIGAFAKTHQALIETRERAVAEAQERAFRAIAAAEASLSGAGKSMPSAVPLPLPVTVPIAERAVEAAQEQADRANAFAEEVVSHCFERARERNAAFESIDPDVAAGMEQATRQAADAQAQALVAVRDQVQRAMSAAERLSLPEAGKSAGT